MHNKARLPATSPELLAQLDMARHHQMSPDEIEAQRRSWVIGELMLDDPAMSKDAAEALYDEATTAAADYENWIADCAAILTTEPYNWTPEQAQSYAEALVEDYKPEEWSPDDAIAADSQYWDE